jgi:predicted peptidase
MNSRTNHFLISVFLMMTGTFALAQSPESWMDAYKPHTHKEMPYRLISPMELKADTQYPVILSLHGGGGRGADNRKQLRGWNRLLAEPERRAAFPCYVLAPQSERLWDGEHLKLIKEIINTLPSADLNRIYVMGHSMGGHGSYILIQLDTSYFAAAAPSAGAGLPDTEPFIDATLIKDIPIWTFHGDQDPTCPYERTRELFEELETLGGIMKFTTWAGDKHGGRVAEKMITGGDNGSTEFSSSSCDPEPDFLKWLFSQSLADR